MTSRFSRPTMVGAITFGLTVPLGAHSGAGPTLPTIGATQTGPSAAQPAAPTTLATMPEVKQRDGVRYLSGGVGQDERDAFRAAARDFNLHLSFAQHGSGAYVALVDVTVRDAQGREVVRIPQAGPILMVRLPHGNYSIEASYGAQSQTRQVAVGEKMTRILLTWPATVRQPAS